MINSIGLFILATTACIVGITFDYNAYAQILDPNASIKNFTHGNEAQISHQGEPCELSYSVPVCSVPYFDTFRSILLDVQESEKPSVGRKRTVSSPPNRNKRKKVLYCDNEN